MTTGTFVVQNSGRLVIVFLYVSHQQIGQIVENEPLLVMIDHGVEGLAFTVAGSRIRPTGQHKKRPHRLRRKCSRAPTAETAENEPRHGGNGGLLTLAG